MTTQDKVAYGVAAGAVTLYAVKAVPELVGTSQPDDSSSDVTATGLPIWFYLVLVIVALGIGAYITREVVG